MPPVVRIDPRFCGPPESGNGGYVAGLLAREVGGFDCMVTLKAPPPLNVALRVEQRPAAAELWSGDTLIAEAVRTEIGIDAPKAPNLAAAEQAELRFVGFRHHVFPGCFVCGPERADGDGLRIFPGSIDEPGLGGVAATWTPDPGLADESGHVASEFVWAALDCPGYFAVQDTSGPAVLGRMGVALHCLPVVEKRTIVVGWPIESSGRKHVVGTALYDLDGKLMAAARATWISIDPSDWKR